jgi:Ca-activated chloride channel family protein
MNCEECRDAIVVRMYGELTPEEEQALERHVDGCPSCARAFARTRSIRNVFDVGDNVPPPDWEASWRVIRDRSKGRRGRLSRLILRMRLPMNRREWALATTVFAVIGLTVGAALVMRQQREGDAAPDALSVKPMDRGAIFFPRKTDVPLEQHLPSGRTGEIGDKVGRYASVLRESWNTEAYDRIYDNEFLETIENPYSTFSIDVDAASYSNVRRFLRQGTLPPADAVRIEELVNYFTYDYPDPEGDDPFSITTEVAACPWNGEHKLVHIGLQGKRVPLEELPPNNLVFLLDVSGSMQPPNKLPLLKRAFRLLAEKLRPEDRVAIVVYASATGLVLPSTAGDNKEEILEAIDHLEAGGSTAGGAGIKLAYKVAEENFIKDGNNRVILATDGDFNTGVSSDAEMVRLIEEKRENGVFITALGFGYGNLKDSKLEKIADHGNGHYAYIDDIAEARKVLVNELGATLYTIAKDVKIQVEFNPAKVASYRLIGYENRMLKKEDFDNDKKDAGEIGAGHSVTALYEIVPARKREVARKDHKTKYMTVSVDPQAFETDEILTVRFRYKAPDEDESRLITQTLAGRAGSLEDASEDFRFAAAVAQWGMLLRSSENKGEASYESVLNVAKGATGKDEHGYRHEFVRLVEMCREIDGE